MWYRSLLCPGGRGEKKEGWWKYEPKEMRREYYVGEDLKVHGREAMTLGWQANAVLFWNQRERNLVLFLGQFEQKLYCIWEVEFFIFIARHYVNKINCMKWHQNLPLWVVAWWTSGSRVPELPAERLQYRHLACQHVPNKQERLGKRPRCILRHAMDGPFHGKEKNKKNNAVGHPREHTGDLRWAKSSSWCTTLGSKSSMPRDCRISETILASRGWEGGCEVASMSRAFFLWWRERALTVTTTWLQMSSLFHLLFLLNGFAALDNNNTKNDWWNNIWEHTLPPHETSRDSPVSFRIFLSLALVQSRQFHANWPVWYARVNLRSTTAYNNCAIPEA